jgi:hypothetical protein
MALVNEPYIIALYGSRARGDYDEHSDIDVLAVVDRSSCAAVIRQEAKQNISSYTWAEFEAMHSYGSLFLWHLKLQSQPLKYNSLGLERFNLLMNTLPEYNRAAIDIASFRLSLADVREALTIGDSTYEYELSCIATTVRHSCILGCYLLGAPEFGRYTAVARFCRMAGLPAEIAKKFVRLYQFRMMSARDAKPPICGALDAYAEDWLIQSTRILEEVSTCYRRNVA